MNILGQSGGLGSGILVADSSIFGLWHDPEKDGFLQTPLVRFRGKGPPDQFDLKVEERTPFDSVWSHPHLNGDSRETTVIHIVGNYVRAAIGKANCIGSSTLWSYST